ncbi:MAG: DUF357 domain-containing protein [Thermoprotei archaeon]|nr:MAG: DUF357 domain-containing protein [Thermoprotei archaeon]RLF24370.1 MAG: DUF357 domain-containing protein [Thermoprotei archaeon]
MEALRERLERYIMSMERTLSHIKIIRELNGCTRRILENVKAYLEDARHYLKSGDYATGLVCIAYGEGLLDSLREIGAVSYEWSRAENPRRVRVLVAGTFDIIHPGHIFLFKKAWSLGKVCVVVARDVNVKRFKGRRPIVPEKQRLEVVKAIRWVDEAILGDEKDIIKSVERLRPDIILLGPDQPLDEEKLYAELKKRGLDYIKVIRLKEKYKGCTYPSTSSIVEAIREFMKSNQGGPQLQQGHRPSD